MPPILTIIAMSAFAVSLTARAIEPVLPQIGNDLAVSIAVAASLSAANALTFALVQPFLGALADLFGKARLVIACLLLLAAASAAGAFATSFEVLFATRIVAGIGAGGVFPIAMGLTSDLVPTHQRQVAMSRVLGGAMMGNLLGATFSGLIGDFVGWRGVLMVLGLLVLIASFAVAYGFRGVLSGPAEKMPLSQLRQGYRAIFANPNARVCFTAVFIEGLCILGLFPFVAAFLADLGEPRLSIAGLVIAGFATGGLFYTLTVSRLLPRLGVKGMMIGGGLLGGAQLAFVTVGAPWPAQLASFFLMGWGFYSLHGSLQIFSSDLAPEARASALAIHSFFFFMGQAAGPVVYGFGLTHFGKTATMLISAAIVVTLGFVCARLLRPQPTGAKDAADI
jgi:predicted MFS family arabinose efflux permease